MENRQSGNLTPFFHEAEEIRRNWGWFLALGIVLVVLGCAVIGSAAASTVFSVVVLGIFLVISGVVQIVQSFLTHKWSGFFALLLAGLLSGVIGLLCMMRPEATAIGLTLLISVFLFVAGLFKMLSALIIRYNEWGWVFFNGLVTFILGFLIYAQWPFSGLWVIGLFVGIDMILSGWTWIALSLAARRWIKG